MPCFVHFSGIVTANVIKKSTAQTSFFHSRYVWCVHQSGAKRIIETTSAFTDVSCLRDIPPRLAAYQVSNKHTVCCCWSRPCIAYIFPSFATVLFWILLLSRTRLVLFKLTSCAEIPAAIIEREVRVADFRQVASLRVTDLTNWWTTDVFRTKRRLSLPRTMQIGSGSLSETQWPQFLCYRRTRYTITVSLHRVSKKVSTF